MQALKTMIFKEERPAGEAAADASFQPGKGSFTLGGQSENASDLIIGMVRVAK